MLPFKQDSAKKQQLGSNLKQGRGWLARLVSWFLITAASVSVALAALLFGMGIWLTSGPIALNGVVQYLQDHLPPPRHFQWQSHDMTLSWAGLGHPLILSVRDFSLKGDGFSAFIPHGTVSITPFANHDHPLAASITMTDPQWRVAPRFLNNDGADGGGGNDWDGDFSFVSPWVSSIHVRGGGLIFDGWAVPLTHIQIDFQKNSHGFSASFAGQEKGQTLSVDLTTHRDKGSDFNIHIPDSVSGAALAPWLMNDVLPNGYGVNVDGSSRLSVKLRGHMDPSGGVGTLDGSVSLTDVTASLGGHVPDAIAVGRFEMVCAARDDHINEVTIRSVFDQGVTLDLRGTGQVDWKRRALSFAVDGAASKIPFDRLNALWPQGLADDVRSWIVTHMGRGLASKATLAASGSVGLPSGDWQGNLPVTLDRLEGDIHVQDVHLTHVAGLPPADRVAGVAHYTKDRFDIAVKGGRSGDLAVTGGRILIDGFQDAQAKMAIELTVEGPVSAALSYLNLPPLALLGQGGAAFFRPLTGQSKTQLNLTFPLTHSLTMKDVGVGATARLSSLVYPVDGGATKRVITSENLDLRLERMVVSARGDVRVGHRTLTGDLTYDGSGKGASNPLQVRLKGALTPDLVQFFGYDMAPYMRGEGPMVCTYEGGGGGRVVPHQVVCSVDLRPANVWILDWEKLAGVPGDLNVTTTWVGDGKLKTAARFTSGVRDRASLDLVVDRDGALEKLTLTPFQLGQNSAALTYHRDGAGGRLDVDGRVLNVYSLMASLDRSRGSSNFPPDLSLKVQGKIDTLILNKDGGFLSDVTLDTTVSKGRIVALQGAAKTIANIKNPNVTMGIDSVPFQRRARQFSLTTNDGGGFLMAAGYGNHVKGGDLTINALYDKERQIWSGKGRLQHFSVKDVPVFARLLSLSGVSGVVGLLSADGLPLQNMRGRFDLAPGKLVIRKGRAVGSSIGLTFGGVVDRLEQTCHLHGSVIPAHFLNTLVGKIPLLGELLTGGRHEGLVSISYQIKGPLKNPSIQTNPISILTPGFIRGVFDPTIDDRLTPDEDGADEDTAEESPEPKGKTDQKVR